MMVIDNKYEIADIVYLITDEDQKRRVITAISISGKGMLYELSCGTTASQHYEFELSKEVNILAKVD